MDAYTTTDIAKLAGVTKATACRWAREAGYKLSKSPVNPTTFSREEVQDIMGRCAPQWFRSRGKVPPVSRV